MSLNSDDWRQVAALAVSYYTGGAYGAAAGGGGRSGGGGVFGAPSGASGFSGGIGSGLDGSGWAVNFRGNQSATSAPVRTTENSANGSATMPGGGGMPLVRQPADYQGLPFVAEGGGMGSNTMMLLALGGLALVVVWRLKK